MNADRPAWYADGLRFSCTGCGNCCTGSPGYVWLSPRDQRAIAEHLGLELDVFLRKFTRLVGELHSLVEQPGGDCVFLDEKKRCRIQAVKPRQCLTFPFWPRLLATRANWDEAASSCPGMNAGARFQPEEVDAVQDREMPREVIVRLFAQKRGAP